MRSENRGMPAELGEIPAKLQRTQRPATARLGRKVVRDNQYISQRSVSLYRAYTIPYRDCCFPVCIYSLFDKSGAFPGEILEIASLQRRCWAKTAIVRMNIKIAQDVSSNCLTIDLSPLRDVTRHFSRHKARLVHSAARCLPKRECPYVIHKFDVNCILLPLESHSPKDWLQRSRKGRLVTARAWWISPDF